MAGSERSARRRGAAAARRARRPWTVLVASAVLPAVLTGCAAMPDSGGVGAVQPEQHGDDQNLQVRVFPVPPQKDLRPRALLQDFLDATLGDDRDYATARQYLTPAARRAWNPDAGVVVLVDGARVGPPPQRSGADGTAAGGTAADRVELTVTGRQAASLDAHHSYTPAVPESQVSEEYSFVRRAGQWRIDRLPQGLVVNQTNFRTVFQQVDRYYFAESDPSSPAADPVLVPDPVYLRRRVSPVATAARALVEGPSGWLAPVVTSAFAGVRLLGHGPVPDDTATVRVRVDVPDFTHRREACRRMAAQLLYTLAGQAGSTVQRVEVSGRASGCSLALGSAEARAYGPAGRAAQQVHEYLVDSGGRLRMLDPDGGAAVPVPGALGAAQPRVRIGSFAVRQADEAAAAVVDQSGRALYQVGLNAGAGIEPPVLVSHATAPAQGLSEPSWDGLDGLWVADRDPASPAVWLLRGEKRVRVPVRGLAGRTVRGLKVSYDGVRVALLLSRGSSRTVALGVIRHGGTPDRPVAEITGLRAVAPQLKDVTSVSWAGPDRLLVLGKEDAGVKQPQFVSTDGSYQAASALQAIEGMTVVAASQDPDQPVLADSGEGVVYRLEPNGQWKAVSPKGREPAYPG